MLFVLVLRFRALDRVCNFYLHAIHITGDGMIAQGSDDLLQGCILERFVVRMAMFSFSRYILGRWRVTPSVFLSAGVDWNSCIVSLMSEGWHLKE